MLILLVREKEGARKITYLKNGKAIFENATFRKNSMEAEYGRLVKWYH